MESIKYNSKKRQLIGMRIYSVISKRKLSFKKYAELLGGDEVNAISKDTVNRICNGKQLPTFKFLDLFENLELNNKENDLNYDKLFFGEEKAVERLPLVKLKGVLNLNNNTHKKFLELCKKKAGAYSKINLDRFDNDENDKVKSKRFFTLYNVDIKSICKVLGLNEKTAYRNVCTPTVDFMISFCDCFNVSADFFRYEYFSDIPSELSEILVDYSYPTQIELLKAFTVIAKNLTMV